VQKVTFDDFTIHRALVMDFRNDTNVYDIKDQFMFGNEFLVSPVVEQNATSRKVFLPKTSGGWIDYGLERNTNRTRQSMLKHHLK